jgi:acyl carrier protein
VGCCTFEVTAASAHSARSAGAQTVPIGRPLANTRAYVADARGHLVPRGVAGELLVGGRGVSAGYINRADMTAERFSADPFSSASGDRVYHTGDRVRRLGTGDLEFLGRTDDQVKIRGYRVEPGEIAQVLGTHPGVQQAAVIARRASASEEPVLVGYVVARSAGYAAAHAERPTAERLLQYLVERLPDYMVPSQVMLLDAMPLSANGKLDRGALPDPAATAAADLHVAPVTATEIAVAQIWSEVLKRDRVGATDNFLALGGHSLLAIRVLGRISKQLGVRLPLRTLFEAPTVTGLAAVIDEAQRAKEAELLAALADVEGMSDADVARGLQKPGAPS